MNQPPSMQDLSASGSRVKPTPDFKNEQSSPSMNSKYSSLKSPSHNKSNSQYTKVIVHNYDHEIDSPLRKGRQSPATSSMISLASSQKKSYKRSPNAKNTLSSQHLNDGANEDSPRRRGRNLQQNQNQRFSENSPVVRGKGKGLRKKECVHY